MDKDWNIRLQLQIPIFKGLVTHKRKSLDADFICVYLHFCLFDLLLYVPINNYSHIGTLAVERDVKQ